MAFKHGKDAHLTVATKDLSAFCDNVEITNETATASPDVFGEEAMTYVTGKSNATVSASGKFDSTASTGPADTLSALVGAEATSPLVVGPEGSTTGMPRRTCNAFMTSYVESIPVGDIVSWSAEFQVSGPVTYDSFPV